MQAAGHLHAVGWHAVGPALYMVCWCGLPRVQPNRPNPPCCSNTFRVERLALATDASLEPQTGCTGKGGLKSKDLDKSGLSREELGCAWQNATGGCGVQAGG